MTKQLRENPPNEIDRTLKGQPKLNLELSDGNNLRIGIEGDWGAIVKAGRSVALADGIMSQIAQVGSKGQSIDEAAANFVIGYVDGMAPKDPAEVLLFTQMAVTHQTLMMLARRLNNVDTIQQAEAADRAYNKTARTFTAQLEALKRYRSNGKQLVRVERVTVQEGGQAIVGNVKTGGRSNAKS
jgi:hypothetical protein